MYIVEITLKNTPLSLAVQRKSAEDAEATYKQVVEAMQSGKSVIELTCDRQPGKKVAILGSEISAIQIADKSGTAAASGRPPGFFALAE